MTQVTVRKGNHPDEKEVRTGQRKASHRTERGFLERPHEKAEIKNILRLGKTLAFSKDTCHVQKEVRLKVTPRKVGIGLKRKGLNMEIRR